VFHVSLNDFLIKIFVFVFHDLVKVIHEVYLINLVFFRHRKRKGGRMLKVIEYLCVKVRIYYWSSCCNKYG
jgi:hypothetical protein